MSSKKIFHKLFYHLLIIGILAKSCINQRQEENLPSYEEYLRKQQQEASAATTIETTAQTNNRDYMLDLPVIAPVPNFPSIKLCKESPSDMYGHVFCIIMLAAYILLVISLVVYQLRSILWFKANLAAKKFVGKETQTNGYNADNQNSISKSPDEKYFSRMLPI